MDKNLQKQREKNLVELFHGAPISINTGMRLDYTEEGRARFTFPYNPKFNHALGGVHGGMIATLLDNAGWFTVAPHFEFWVATVELSVRLLEPVAEEDLWAIGRIVRLGKRLATADMEVRTKKDRLIAMGAGTFSTTTVPLEPKKS